MDNLDDRVNKFFEAAKKTKPESKTYEAIRKVTIEGAL